MKSVRELQVSKAQRKGEWLLAPVFCSSCCLWRVLSFEGRGQVVLSAGLFRFNLAATLSTAARLFPQQDTPFPFLAGPSSGQNIFSKQLSWQTERSVVRIPSALAIGWLLSCPSHRPAKVALH